MTCRTKLRSLWARSFLLAKLFTHQKKIILCIMILMEMIRRLSLYLFAIVFASLLFTSSADARLDDLFPGEPYGPTSIGTCKTAWDINTAGTCGTSCPDLCSSQAMDLSTCQQVVSSQVKEWGEYDIKEERVKVYGSFTPEGYYWDYGYSASYTATRTCSIGDKYNPSGNLTQLYAGQCSCTAGSPPSVGNQYKVCCQANGNLDTSTRTPINSLPASWEDDGIPWPEGNCPLGGGGQETVFGSSCPQPPQITLTANGAGVAELQVKNEEKVTLEWRIIGYDRADANITGVQGSPASGSYVFSPFPKNTPPGQKLDLWINAYDDYTGYSTPSANDVSGRSVKAVKTLTLISSGDGTPPCLINLPKSQGTKCADFNYYPQRTDGKKSGDGTTNDYTKDAIVFIDPPLVNGQPSCKPKDDQSVGCYSANCSRCSNTAPNIGKFAEWSTDSVDYINKACLTFNSIKYSPASGSDIRCSEPLGGCFVDAWKIDSAVAKGGKPKASWTAKPSPSNPADAVKTCVMTPGKGNAASSSVPISVSETSPEEFGPINADTTYTLNCATNSGGKCSVSGTVKIGCAVNTFTATPSTISQGQSSKLAWTTTKASGCALSSGGSFGANDSTTVSPTPPSSTYTVTCNTTGYPTTCSKSVTVTVNPPIGACIGNYSDVSVSVSATPICLPSQPGDGRNSTVSYSASANNSCVSVIGGGSSSPDSVTCSPSSNWNPSRSGSGSETVSPSQTTSYSISCLRPNYTCTRTGNYSSGTSSQNQSACESARTTIVNAYKNNIASSTCSEGSCARNYTSADCSGYSGTSCPRCSSWTQARSTGTCDNKKPEGICSVSGGTCGSSADCPKGESCTNIRQVGTCSNGQGSCTQNSDCTYYYDVRPCLSYYCKDYSYDLNVRSKDVCGSSNSSSAQLRVIQKPNTPTLSATAKYVSGNTYQILLNQLFNISWSVSAPSSLVPTILRCTASGSGDPEVWDDKGLNGLISSGTVKDFIGSFLSPNGTTTYSLWCRNQDQTLPNSCYNNGPTNSVEVKVYTPDLQEKGPTSFNFVRKFMGMIGGGW